LERSKRMIITTRKDIIESILINTLPFLERKDPTNITSHVYINATETEVIVRSTDNEIGLQTHSDQFTIVETGTFTANGKKLLDIVRSLQNDIIEFEIDGDYLFIKQKSTKFKLPTFSYQEYPSFPSIENKAEISLDSFELIKSLKKIIPAIDVNNPKFELNGALIDIKKNKTSFVGTDTRRLAVVELEKESQEELDLIIPKKAIIEIQKLFLDQISIFYDENHIIIKNDQFFLFSRLINGKFPEYSRIIPQSFKHIFTIPKKELIDAMKVINIISSEVLLTLEQNLITLKSLNSDTQEAQTTIETTIHIDEPLSIAINSKYLFDFISQVDTNDFELKVNEPTLPFLVKSENFLTVIMPILL
jgi:DNA polymerase-3 subunit beta